MKFFAFLWTGTSALAWLLPATAIAQAAMVQIADGAQSSRTPFNVPVAVATLEDQRGGMQGISSEMKLSGTTANNSATDVLTGTNTISAGAFANMSGLPVVIQNSGANVLIQNAVILNLQMN